jgi:hypothetical protein
MNGELDTGQDLGDEATYDSVRLSQWLAGRAGGGVSRRGALRLFGGAGLAAAAAPLLGAGAAHAAKAAAATTPATSGPIVKPLPPD